MNFDNDYIKDLKEDIMIYQDVFTNISNSDAEIRFERFLESNKVSGSKWKLSTGDSGTSISLIMNEEQVAQLRDKLTPFYTNQELDKMYAEETS